MKNDASTPAVTRAGFAALIGQPNAGKSTLLNRLVGEKLAIVSARPQTTRNRVTGIRHRPGAQTIFVDTPGLHAGGGKLGEFMMQTVERAVEDVDLVCLVVDATARDHPDPLALRGTREAPDGEYHAALPIDDRGRHQACPGGGGLRRASCASYARMIAETS